MSVLFTFLVHIRLYFVIIGCIRNVLRKFSFPLADSLTPDILADCETTPSAELLGFRPLCRGHSAHDLGLRLLLRLFQSLQPKGFLLGLAG